MWDILGTLGETLGALFAGGNPFHGAIERPASYWLGRIAGLLLFAVVIAAVWYAGLRAL